jgi:hypothetical protein
MSIRLRALRATACPQDATPRDRLHAGVASAASAAVTPRAKPSSAIVSAVLGRPPNANVALEGSGPRGGMPTAGDIETSMQQGVGV